MLASDCIGSDGCCCGGGGATELDVLVVVFRFNISPRPFAFGRGACGAMAAPCGPSLF